MCVELQQGKKCQNTTCESGCFCPEGELMDKGECVPENECGCVDVLGVEKPVS